MLLTMLLVIYKNYVIVLLKMARGFDGVVDGSTLQT